VWGVGCWCDVLNTLGSWGLAAGDGVDGRAHADGHGGHGRPPACDAAAGPGGRPMDRRRSIASAALRGPHAAAAWTTVDGMISCARPLLGRLQQRRPTASPPHCHPSSQLQQAHVIARAAGDPPRPIRLDRFLPVSCSHGGGALQGGPGRARQGRGAPKHHPSPLETDTCAV
jgi:hypothetical protein